ncbi:oxidoreductase [Hungatella hathewayi]
MYEKLYEPVKVCGISLKNRFVMPAMNSNLGDAGHFATERMGNYYAERAKGGFGLLITEFICVAEEGLASPIQLAIYDDKFIPQLAGLTKKVHDSGGKIFAQLHHSGNIRFPGLSEKPAVGASVITVKGYSEPVHELLTEEIPVIEQEFIDASIRAKNAGFDGIEVHGAHGYLLAQFLSKSTNKRVDQYGGSITNRARIVCEIVRGIKEACGADYPVSVRISGDEGREDGNSIEDAAAQSMLFEEAGADLINVSYGTAIESYYARSGFNIQNVKRIKEVVDVPVIGIGRMNDPTLMLSAVKSGAMDLVALGRESVCDSHLPQKIKEGRLQEIFTCTGCMQRCLYGNSFEEEGGISCMINPFSGKEGLWEIKDAAVKKKIAVAGAGPAGLQAAWILAKRGHSVTVYEMNESAGGAYRLAGIPRMKQELSKTISTYCELCKKYGVVIRYKVKATKSLLEKEQFQEIVIATGALPVIPRSIEGIANENVYIAQDILAFKKVLKDNKVLVLGAGLVGAETAEVLGEYGNQVTIVDMLDRVAPLAPERPREGLLKQLNRFNTEYILKSKVLKINADGIDYEQDGERKTISGFQYMVLAFGSKPNNELLVEIKDNPNVHVIGDALKAGDAKKAIYEASKLGMIL